MNEKNMLEQNRRDIMRQLGFRQTAAAMDIIDPLPYPEAATPWKTASNSMWSTPAIAAVMGQAALDGMTAHETKMGEALMAKLRDKLSIMHFRLGQRPFVTPNTAGYCWTAPLTTHAHVANSYENRRPNQ